MDPRRGEGIDARPRHGQRATLEPDPAVIWAPRDTVRYPEGPDPGAAEGQGSQSEVVLPQDQFRDAVLPAVCDRRAEDSSSRPGGEEGSRGTGTPGHREPERWDPGQLCSFLSERRHHRSAWPAGSRTSQTESGHAELAFSDSRRPQRAALPATT